MSSTKIAELEDRSACAAWSPVSGYGSLIALGTKDSGGVSFDQDTGGTLELYDSEKNDIVGALVTAARFSSLLWVAATDAYPAGLIVGGMADGTLQIWDAQAMLEATDASVGSVSLDSTNPVTALAASPLDTQNICAGTSSGQVVVLNLSSQPFRSKDPAPGHKHKSAAVTAVAWNSQVAHIVATGSAEGTVTVWDLASGKPWCEIATGSAVADVHWNPTQGLYLVTASAEDRNPVLLLWDLRSSTSMPLATLTGHQSGILKTAWCPHDDALLLSCARDHRTILWDLYTLQPLADLPVDSTAAAQPQQQQSVNPSALFASKSLNDQHLLRYFVQWSTIKRGVALTCSLDRKIQVHSILALANKSGRPPAWMKPKSFVSTGFGGLLVSSAPNNVVSISCVSEDVALVKRAIDIETSLAYGSPADFCASRTGHPWGFLSVIFASNARQELLQHLKLDANEIAAAAENLCQDLSKSPEHSLPLPPDRASKHRGMTPQVTNIVQKAMMVGNFEAAVECCFQAGNFVDALLLASCGGSELWSKTQERYFAQETNNKPYLPIARAILKANGLSDWVSESELKEWQQTLAILATYGQSEEFPLLCTLLGNRLAQQGELEAATDCFICALNLTDAVPYWQLQMERKAISLEEFCLRVFILQQATPQTPVPESVANNFFEYAFSLSQQGLLATAAKYCAMGGDSESNRQLKDRLYRSRASPRCLAAMKNVPPEFPYSAMNLTKSAGQYLVYPLHEQQEQQHNAEVYSNSHQNFPLQTESVQSSQQPYQQQSTQNGQKYGSDELPDGWVALQDPSSGMTYYANQNTGETTWEKPQPLFTQQPSQQQPYVTSKAAVTPSKREAVVAKYGDGFVTSASHPELASQYGNVGTSNPYKGTERPGIAVVGGGQKPPISGTLNFDNFELTADHHEIKDSLLGLVDALRNNAQLNPVEKRQLAETEKAIAILVKKMARGELAEDTTGKVYSMVGAVNNSDLVSASLVQTDLANHDWRDHKDWLKGIKLLIQLGVKKFT
ncbi:protein transport protein SEC31 [Fistulifera solaris]|uniref:Protein transport protein SEC31 n=1 Tax=Fistulifera solaris TaxID=1519565 RepID=A0A1Z5K0S4_FISSO|nr:protein transport protein SEC31 [Fistulifera solaris]|eukprot:GAX19890.1 protein transport protein SEC31 [Fistulifera solaris]